MHNQSRGRALIHLKVLNLVDALILSYKLHQLINEPTHILPRPSFYIDPIFTNHPNLLIKLGQMFVQSANCYHQINCKHYCKLNLKMKYSPPYWCLVCNFKRADITSGKTAILWLIGNFCSPIKA